MTLFLVRHAQAGSRALWQEEDDTLRPLTSRGRHQAADLVGVLGELTRAAAVWSSPYRRCVETVAPLAAALGVSVKTDDRLGEGSGSPALALVRAYAKAPRENKSNDAVMCSHGDVIPWLLDHLARNDDLDLGSEPRCQKGSVWMLEPGPSGTFVQATYIPPP